VTIAEVVDSSAMQLEVQIDEIDVVGINPGQRTIVEVDAVPEIRIEGQVSFISLLPSIQSGVVVYGTRISFDTPSASGLRVGMSASADIIVAERKSVLLIPDRAIGRNSQGKSTVTLMVEGRPQEREVTPGVTDGIQTEVLDGLAEGETVVVERASQQNPGLF
jgi:HlyD family secretion protein